MNPALSLAAVVAFAFVAVFIAHRSRHNRSEDLGQVSSQWVMEHRSSAGYDPSHWRHR